MSESSNRRKFRVGDNTTIFNTLEKVLQIKTKIEEQCASNEVDLEELPMSTIPTPILYAISACYAAMYDKLLDEELIQAGYPKSTKVYN